MGAKSVAVKKRPARVGASVRLEAQKELARYKVEAVSRAVLLLKAFGKAGEALTVEALASRTGLGVATVEASLATLAKRGLVQPASGETPAWRLGLAWLRIADVKRRQLDLREVAKPVMWRIRDAVNETVSIGVRLGTSRANIEYAESNHEVRRIVQPGFNVPLHVGAGGLALMSGMDDEEIEAYLAPVGMTHLQKTKLVAAIQVTRREGYAIVEGEVTSDTSAISAPVRNHIGDIVGVLTITMPQERCTDQFRTRCIKEVVKGAREISLAMGFDPARESA